MDGDRNGNELERKLNELLTEGKIKESDSRRRERNRISPKYEIRVQTVRDPIVEETNLYRQMGQEVDDRYDRYMEKAGHGGEPPGEKVTEDEPSGEGSAEGASVEDRRAQADRSHK